MVSVCMFVYVFACFFSVRVELWGHERAKKGEKKQFVEFLSRKYS